MTNENAIKRLVAMNDMMIKHEQKVRANQKWTPAEKKLTLTDIANDKEAISIAINCLTMRSASFMEGE